MPSFPSPLFNIPSPLPLRQCHLCLLLHFLLPYSVNAICLFSLSFFSTLYRPLSILYDTLYLKCPLKTVNFTHDIIGLSILNIEWGLHMTIRYKKKVFDLKNYYQKVITSNLNIQSDFKIPFFYSITIVYFSKNFFVYLLRNSLTTEPRLSSSFRESITWFTRWLFAFFSSKFKFWLVWGYFAVPSFLSASRF